MIKAYHAASLFEKIRGLTGKKPFPLFFQTRFGIHTFGMIFPIDVVILDDCFTVKKIKKNLLPNRIFLWNIRYKNVLELPQGAIKSKKIVVGKIITVRYLKEGYRSRLKGFLRYQKKQEQQFQSHK